MKKHGFTLVELLAVIAILAILVIIALPNVMNLFNRAKENAFETELKEIYKTAQQQWIADSMFQTEERVYARCKNEECENQLDMSGRVELEYYIRINKSGDVVSFHATDGSYQFVFDGPSLTIDDVKDVQQISKIDASEKISISCGSTNTGSTRIVYTTSGTVMTMGQVLPEGVNVYDSISQLGSAYSFIKMKLENNVITEAQIGFKKNDTFYYLKIGSGNYATNKQVILNAVGSSYCSSSNILTECRDQFDNHYYASDGGLIVADASDKGCISTTTSFKCE